MSSATVVVPTLGGDRIARMFASLAAQGTEHQTVVIANGGSGAVVEAAIADAGLQHARVLHSDENLGYTRAINRGVDAADGDTVVLLNDDCVCDPEFVERITARVDPAAGVAMAAGVMRDWRDRGRIDSAGMELDPTLLVFDYLNGEPLSLLDAGVADPIGPSAAAAAFDRATFRSVGGFDENLFAYWEDVDLVLRLRRVGLRCVLAPDARGDHEHSATLGSGSAKKNYLMGYGRGYVLRKWGVVTPGRLPGVLVREGVLCAGQIAIDRNVSGLRGRVHGFRAAPRLERYPAELDLGTGGGALATLRRRAVRRARLRSRTDGDAPSRSLAVFHLAETSGPSRSLEAELSWLAQIGELTAVIPGDGPLRAALNGSEVIELDYEALTTTPSGPVGLLREARRLWRDVRSFRRLIRERKPSLVVSVTSMLPAVPIAARLERTPVLIYCGELFDRGHRGAALRALAGRALTALTARLGDGIIACSQTVAAQFAGTSAVLETIYPPVDPEYGDGDGPGLRRRLGIAEDAPLLASVGALTEGRGQDVLLRALPTLRERFPGLRLLVAGEAFPRPQDRAYRDGLLALVRDLGLEDAVVLGGHFASVADVYAAADVIVNPARASESFGRVPFEAALAGTPSVVTRVGAIPELLRDERSALIVDPENSLAIANAVTRLLHDEALGESLAAEAAAFAREHLRPRQSLDAFRRTVAATRARVR